MTNSLENAVMTFYSDIFTEDFALKEHLLLHVQSPLDSLGMIRDAYNSCKLKLSQWKEREDMLRKSQEELQSQLRLNRELTLANETLKKKYNELKLSKNQLNKEYEEIEETNDALSSELIQSKAKVKELQGFNEELIQELSQAKYELNSLQMRMEKSKSIKNIFGTHSTIIGYVEEEEISAINPMSRSLNGHFMVNSLKETKSLKQSKEFKAKKKKTNKYRAPISKQTVHPSIFKKKVINVNDAYFKETECQVMRQGEDQC